MPNKPPARDKAGFPVTPAKDRFADDLGYWTTPKRKAKKVAPKYLLGNT